MQGLLKQQLLDEAWETRDGNQTKIKSRYRINLRVYLFSRLPIDKSLWSSNEYEDYYASSYE